MCLLLDEFLRSYTTKLGESDINEFTDEELQTIRSAVILLLRRHNIDGRICCHDNENELKVTAIDEFGFVTQVQCTSCNQLMDTTCYEEWTKERIHDEAQLNEGDHICWHRPYAIWHHAIVTIPNPDPNQTQVIHYVKEKIKETTLSEVKKCRESCKSCDALYRINHRDSYNVDYTTLRAQKLLSERKYNLFKRNCEHFISWCKTGSAKSIQVNVFLASLGKLVATVSLRVIALFILFLIQWLHEESEEVNDSQSQEYNTYETLEKWLTCLYVVVVTILFVIYILITSCSKLALNRRSRERHDNENSSTCCGRPCNLVCGIFSRIFLREISGLIATVCIVLYEDEIVTSKYPPGLRAFLIVLIISASQLVCYTFGACAGRWVESCCE